MKTKILPILVLMLFATVAKAQQLIPVTSDQLTTLTQSESKLIIIDLRTPGEFSQGYINKARNIDAYSPDLASQLNQLDKNAPYLIYCRTKNRSTSVGNYMLQNGFKKVYQMMDGYAGYQSKALSKQ